MRNSQKRELILEAIRTTAKANNNIPLGIKAFENQTGIKQTEWRGIYWARWSDAIKDAGLVQINEFTVRTEKSVLLDKLIPAIRHFGKIPTIMESRIYSKTISKLPADNTIRNHFPTKPDLIKALADYAVGKPELDDIASLFARHHMLEENVTKSAAKEGHVYLLKSGNHYKIGKSDNLERRVKEITVAMPEALTLIHAIRTDDPDGIEAYWHKRFAQYRAKGEWFKLSTPDITAFKRRKFQ